MDADEPGTRVLCSNSLVVTENLAPSASCARPVFSAQNPASVAAPIPVQFSFFPCFVRVDKAWPWFYLPGLALLLVGQVSIHSDG
jgi:hypothetical protein